MQLLIEESKKEKKKKVLETSKIKVVKMTTSVLLVLTFINPQSRVGVNLTPNEHLRFIVALVYNFAEASVMQKY